MEQNNNNTQEFSGHNSQTIENNTENVLDIQAIIGACFARWWWFILSVVIVISGTMFYLLTTPKIYTRELTFLIKESGGRTSSFNSQLNSFAEMGVFENSTSVNNELTIIQSPTIILETVKRLHLEYDYFVQGKYRKEAIYGDNLPVQALLVDADEFTTGSFTLIISPDGSFKMTDFSTPALTAKLSDIVEGVIGDEVSTPLGKVFISATPNLSEYKEPITIYIRRLPLRTAMLIYSAKYKAGFNDKKSSVISLTVEDENIQRAEDFLNTIFKVYNEKWIEDKNQAAIGTSAFITNRLEIIERELGIVDGDVSSFKSHNLLPNVEKSSDLFYSQANSLENEIVMLSTQVAMAENVKEYISDTTKSNELLPVYSGSNNTTAEKQIT
ncbi:MAG: Wzz/FepE/Etk N-terminal domain-containing protein, partial [Bacteroidales bacterium]|nr:Wzz/FepE/Etk N-terminal domain-containing protein [Bacteroidales bacterium]